MLHTWGRGEVFCGVLIGKLEGSKPMKDLGVDGL
jgi:hypothetical protein